MLLKILLIALAAICKAIVDTIAFHKGGRFTSAFFNINKQGKFLPLTKFPFDGIHIFNSLMILLFLITASIRGSFGFLIDLPLLGIIFIITFNTFFNKILK